MRVRPAGERGLLVEVDELKNVHRLHAALRELDPPGVVELVPGYRTILIVAEPERAGVLDELAARLPGLELPPAEAVAGETAEIPVVYDGEDLPEVASLTGLDADEVVSRHTAPEYTVAFLGFSPGFPYLVGLDPALEVPRDTPRTSSRPAGRPGRRPDRHLPHRLPRRLAADRPHRGDPVRPHPRPPGPARPGHPPPVHGGRMIRVRKAGLLTTVQDLGGRGWGIWGF